MRPCQQFLFSWSFLLRLSNLPSLRDVKKTRWALLCHWTLTTDLLWWRIGLGDMGKLMVPVFGLEHHRPSNMRDSQPIRCHRTYHNLSQPFSGHTNHVVINNRVLSNWAGTPPDDTWILLALLGAAMGISTAAGVGLGPLHYRRSMHFEVSSSIIWIYDLIFTFCVLRNYLLHDWYYFLAMEPWRNLLTRWARQLERTAMKAMEMWVMYTSNFSL